MPIEIGHWSSLYTSSTEEIGNVPSFAVSGILGNGFDFENITAPGQGQGKLYVYSKHYVAITGYDAFTGYRNLSICLLNKTASESVTFGSTAGDLHSITNGSHHYSTLGEVEWDNGPEPQFSTYNGWANSLTISTGDMLVIGVTGGGTGGGGGTGENITPPVEPNIPTPTQQDCDILINCQNFEITFTGNVSYVTDVLQSNNWSGLGLTDTGWTTGDLAERATGDGNWVGSYKGEINLLAQAINMCADQKEYGAVFPNHSDPIGPITIGILSGNAGTCYVSYGGGTNTFPSSRVDKNSTDAFDHSSNSGAPIQPVTGDYGIYGLDLRIVGLTPGCQAIISKLGPSSGNRFPSGTQQTNNTVEIHKLGLRVGVASSGINYIGVFSGFRTRFVLIDVDWLPTDPTLDGFALTTVSFNGKPVIYDAKSAVNQTLACGDLGPLTYFKGNGTSRNYPTNTYSDKVSFLEHNYYIKGANGDIWYAGHGSGALEVCETNRTLSQIRPAPETPEVIPWSGNVVWKDNYITGYSMNNVNSAGEIAGAAVGGGSVMTVWNNHGDTWFINNTVTDAYMQALAVVRQVDTAVQSRVFPDANGWDLNRVFLTGNTLSNYPNAVGTNRATVTFSDMRELHIMPGNTIIPGTQAVAYINYIPDGGDGSAKPEDVINYKVIETVYEYADADFAVDFSGDVKTWKQNDLIFIDVNKNNPVEQIPEWENLGTLGVGFDPGDVASFWLRREFSENYEATGETSLLFGFSADPIG